MSKISVNENYFEVIDTQEKAYWLGYLYADGYASREKPWFIVVQSIDIEHLEKLAATLEYTGTIKRTNSGGYEGSKTQGRLVICRKKMCLDVARHGRYEAPMRIPELEPELVRHFVRGYFDGDGSVYMQMTTASTNKKKYPYLASQIIGEQAFLDEIRKLFLGLTMTTTFKNSKTDHMKYLCIHGGHNLRKMHKYLYEDATVSMTRKAEKWQVLYGPLAEQSALKN